MYYYCTNAAGERCLGQQRSKVGKSMREFPAAKDHLYRQGWATKAFGLAGNPRAEIPDRLARSEGLIVMVRWALTTVLPCTLSLQWRLIIALTPSTDLEKQTPQNRPNISAPRPPGFPSLLPVGRLQSHELDTRGRMSRTFTRTPQACNSWYVRCVRIVSYLIAPYHASQGSACR